MIPYVCECVLNFNETHFKYYPLRTAESMRDKCIINMQVHCQSHFTANDEGACAALSL